MTIEVPSKKPVKKPSAQASSNPGVKERALLYQHLSAEMKKINWEAWNVLSQDEQARVFTVWKNGIHDTFFSDATPQTLKSKQTSSKNTEELQKDDVDALFRAMSL